MNSKLKKVLLVFALLIIFAGIAFVAINASKGKKEAKTENNRSTTVEKVAQGDSNESENVVENNENVETTEKKNITATVETLKDGTKYSVTDKKTKADIVLKDKYFDTQISDINTNFEKYEGKTMQIEGLYFANEKYTFVGRYSTSNLCPYCPTGYSYFEYQWDGDKGPELTDSESWIKVIGTLKKGNDGVDYYYLDAESIELMNEKGQDTVSN